MGVHEEIVGNSTEGSSMDLQTMYCWSVQDYCDSSNNSPQLDKAFEQTAAAVVVDSSVEWASSDDEELELRNVLDHRKSRQDYSDRKTNNCYCYTLIGTYLIHSLIVLDS